MKAWPTPGKSRESLRAWRSRWRAARYVRARGWGAPRSRIGESPRWRTARRYRAIDWADCSAHSGEADHRFRRKPITQSGQADHLSERSDVGVRLCCSVIGLGQWGLCLSHRISLELEFVGDVVEPVEERDGGADFIGAFGLVVGAGLEADFAVKVPGGWDECNPGDEKSRRKALLLAAAGDGVGLRAAPECGPVSTALQAGEGVRWPRRARARSGHSDAACGSSRGALRRTMSSS